MILGTREMFRILKSIGVNIEPKKLKFFYLPVCIIVPVCMLVMKTRIAEFAMAQHTIVAKEEMDALEKQFMTLNIKEIELKYYDRI